MSAFVSDARSVYLNTTTGAVRNRSTVRRFPGGTLLSVDTEEFEQFRDFAQGWSFEQQLIGPQKRRSALSGFFLPSMQVALVEHSMGYSSQGHNPQSTITITVPLDQRPVIFRGQLVDRLHMPLVRSSEGFELVCGIGSKLLVISVQEEVAERYIADVAHKPLMWGRQSGDRLQFSDPTPQGKYIDGVTRLLRTISSSPTLLSQKQNADLIEEKLLECLPLDAYTDSPPVEDRSRFRAARQAYRLLRDRVDEVLSIRDLCMFAGASYATLERGFRDLYGITPKTLMQELRLSRTRIELLHPKPSTTVTAVALRWGFLEFGRFAAQYRERFGEVPRETLRRSRGGHLITDLSSTLNANDCSNSIPPFCTLSTLL